MRRIAVWTVGLSEKYSPGTSAISSTGYRLGAFPGDGDDSHGADPGGAGDDRDIAARGGADSRGRREPPYCEEFRRLNSLLLRTTKSVIKSTGSSHRR